MEAALRVPRIHAAAIVLGLLGLWAVGAFRVKPEKAIVHNRQNRRAAHSEPFKVESTDLRKTEYDGVVSLFTGKNIALLVKDYKDRLPSEAEMLDESERGKLRSFFRELEWELQSKDSQTRLAGHPAQVLQFQGDDADRVTMNGECYMLAFHGYGYWFFTWAPLGDLERDGESIHAE